MRLTRVGSTVLGSLSVLVVLTLALPAFARIAAIETSAPLSDHSDEAIEAALTQAVVVAVRGAVAMGLPWVRVRQAVVVEDVVTVQIVATDTEPDDEEMAEPDSERLQPARIDL